MASCKIQESKKAIILLYCQQWRLNLGNEGHRDIMLCLQRDFMLCSHSFRAMTRVSIKGTS